MTDDQPAALVDDVEVPAAINDDRDPVDVAADEFADRYRNGEHPSVTEYVDRFPDQAEELKELLPAVAMMEQLKQKEESRIDSFERQSVISGLQQLGDFRIIREIGHGGMGVVYEAEQESLGRQVALKVLSPTTFDSPQSIRRFCREAETVARLHHTNIVPVFGVGNEKGLHYYVMQLIDGQPLNDVITGLRNKSKGQLTDSEVQLDLSGNALADDSLDLASIHAAPATRAVRLTNSAAASEEVVVESSINSQQGDESDNKFATTVGQTREKLATVSDNKLADTIAKGKATTEAEEVVSESDDSDSAHRQRGEELLPATERLSTQLNTNAYWSSVAEIGIQVARALDYAHAHNVWHRDIKPSNLLIDQSGTVWLVDFGLARMADDSELTQTGDLLGTLRYMSPEQVVGEFDHRSDVYSLGLTLYELLTFQPAHNASIRSRIVEQISEASPKSPRQINPGIPQDLETIILKATAHNAKDRYQSAKEMTEDLQRFCGGFPIQARRFSVTAQLLRWSRRNPALAWTTATTAILLLTVAALSTWGLVAARNANQDLTEERGRTQIEAKRAEDNLRMALQAFEEIVDRISQRGIPQSVQSDLNADIETENGDVAQPVTNLTPVITEADAELLNQLLQFYIDFASRNKASPEVASQTAKAQRRVGDIYQRLGRHKESIAAYENARSQYQMLSLRELEPSLEEILDRPDAPVTYNATLTVAAISNQIGQAAGQVGDFRTTNESYESSINYLSNLPAEVTMLPETRFLLAQTKTAFASLLSRFGGKMGGGFVPGGFGANSPGGLRDSRRNSSSGRFRDGRKGKNPGEGGGDVGRRNDGPGSDDSGTSRTGNDEASAFLANNRRPGGKSDRDVNRDGRFESRPPGGNQSGFGPPRGGPGRGHGPPKGVKETLKAHRQDARRLLEELTAEDSQQPDYQLELARLLLASASFRGQDYGVENPMSDLNHAIGILEQLTLDHPGNPDYQFQLADALALSSPDTHQFESAEQTAERITRSIEIARKLQKQFPNAPEYDILLANSLRYLSGMQNDQNDLEGSQASVDEAVSILQRLTEVWPGHMIYRLSLAHVLHQSAMLGRRTKRSDFILQRLDEAAAVFDDVESFEEEPVFVPAMLSMIHRGRAEYFIRSGQDAEAKEAWELAVELAPWMTKGPGGPNSDDRGQNRNYGRPGGHERYPQQKKRKGLPPKNNRPPQKSTGQARPDNERSDRFPNDLQSTESDRQKRERPPSE